MLAWCSTGGKSPCSSEKRLVPMGVTWYLAAMKEAQEERALRGRQAFRRRSRQRLVEGLEVSDQVANIGLLGPPVGCYDEEDTRQACSLAPSHIDIPCPNQRFPGSIRSSVGLLSETRRQPNLGAACSTSQNHPGPIDHFDHSSYSRLNSKLGCSCVDRYPETLGVSPRSRPASRKVSCQSPLACPSPAIRGRLILRSSDRSYHSSLLVCLLGLSRTRQGSHPWHYGLL
jgi:hypothetical protein